MQNDGIMGIQGRMITILNYNALEERSEGK